MANRVIFALTLIAAVSACSSDIYLRDGVTDGDTFYLSQRALTDSGPVLQSWVSYSLTRSTCQLQRGGDNPARMNSFDCELTARRHLLDTWADHQESDGQILDRYLDELAEVREAGFLAEYVGRYFARKDWILPTALQPGEFRQWRRKNLRGHKTETRIIGAWNYARDVKSIAMHD